MYVCMYKERRVRLWRGYLYLSISIISTTPTSILLPSLPFALTLRFFSLGCTCDNVVVL